ncbi:MAG: UDP-N-acetylmuramoyl-L-alanyl-D-glutamate--2,6-diaminopimelate ligase [Persephonella sp.]|nr:UDP-N-acetylmuramoyl-L-alanyl-D-glutamate--2,6-diaminopimelate ligase [Persephonella sp.]
MKRKTVLDLFRKGEFFNFYYSHVVSSLTNSSKEVSLNSIFFAIKGSSADGHHFIEDAVRKGAKTVVLQDKMWAEFLRKRYPQINVVLAENTRKMLAEISRIYFDYPDRKLKVIGITGTNGKTTVSHLTAQYLQMLGIKTGIIGTTGYKVEEKILSEGRTTPDPIQWYKTLFQMKQMGAEFVVAEVSSHALDQYRVYGTRFKGVVFTNLSPEHLDYHRDMENYFEAKRRLFSWNRQSPSAVNADDIYGKRLLQEFESSSGYGFSDGAHFRISDVDLSHNGTVFTIFYRGKKYPVRTKLIGKFNVYNTAAAFSHESVRSGFKPEDLSELSWRLTPVRGRIEILEGEGFRVIIDYAHTPDALKNVLETLNSLKNGRIITVFGAGGDRDRSKRPVMGEIASKYSGVIIITSDNPRSENPMEIIQDIKRGTNKNSDVYIIPDREEAIKEAVYMAGRDDTVLIAGKGHEIYQEIKGVKVPFDDRSVAEKYIKKRQQKLPRQEKR